MKLKDILIGLGIGYMLNKTVSELKTKPLLSGTYKEYGNIYSPEIVGTDIYFSGWFDNNDYPYDTIYKADFNLNVVKLLQFPGIQLADPSIIDNKMYMTYSDDPLDVTKQCIAMSKYINNTWSYPTCLISQAWLPSAVKVNTETYIYYTHADSKTNALRRSNINNPLQYQLINCNPILINVDVKYYDKYYMMGDYWYNGIYSIGLWTSSDGINFDPYPNNPIIKPDKNHIIARTPCFIKENNKLKIWYAQQKKDWWTNAIFYKKMEVII